MLLLPAGWQQEGEFVWRRGGGAGAFLVGEKTAAATEEDAAEQEGELVADEVDNTRDAEEEWDKGNIIKVDGEEEVAPVVALPCSAAGTDGDEPGAEGVAAGQRRRSANAERDLRSCTSLSANAMDM